MAALAAAAKRGAMSFDPKTAEFEDGESERVGRADAGRRGDADDMPRRLCPPSLATADDGR